VQTATAGLDAYGLANAFVLTTGNALVELDTVRGWSLLRPPGTPVSAAAGAADDVFAALADGSVVGHSDTYGWYSIFGPGFSR
jgi:hypothetical protein